MTMKSTTGPRKFKEYFPKSGTPLYIFIAVVVMAFFLGWMISGDSPSNSQGAEDGHSQTEEATVWTCSMHPQIKLPKAGQCPICFMDLIPLESSSDDDLGERQLKMSETAVELARISVTPAIREFASGETRMVGKIDYDETKLAYITAWAPGRIDSLYADYTGVSVRRGDPLVQLYSPELLSAQEELLQAKQAAAKLSENTSSVFKSTIEATLEAAREKLNLLGLTPSQISEIEKSNEFSSHITINAPLGGVVVHMNAREGIYVKTGTPIYTIADLSEVWAMFDVYESDLAWLREGQEVEFRPLAFPGEKFTGRISFIDPILNEKTRTVKVRVIADNKAGKLKPGMFVSGTVKSMLDINGNVVSEGSKNKSKAPILIPSTAPLLTGTRAVVYVQVNNDDGFVFEGRVIELGPLAGDQYIVKSGLNEGELVVTNGAFKIDSELQIQAKPSMMTPQGGGGMLHQHGGEDQPKSPVKDHSKHETLSYDTSQDALSALEPVYESYFKIQMALASDDLSQTKDGFAELNKNTQAVNMSLFKGDSHIAWMDLSGKISDISKSGISIKDMEKSRELFLELSKVMINLNKSLGHGNGENFYLTFCPMANNNKGAYWLQTVDTVYNSFYGESMLRCGSIKDTIEAK